jgi:hypothetical protein
MRAISAQADQEDVLVPVRIDMESNGYQLRDTFTWNLNGMYRLLASFDWRNLQR